MLDLLDLLESMRSGWYWDALQTVDILRETYRYTEPQRLNRLLAYALYYACTLKHLSFVCLLLNKGARLSVIVENNWPEDLFNFNLSFHKKLVVLDLDETLFSSIKEFKSVNYCKKRVLFGGYWYYLINYKAHQYIFEHLLLSAHKVIILTSALYRQEKVTTLLNKYFLPKGSVASFNGVKYYNGLDYGDMRTSKGEKLVSIINNDVTSFKYSDILLLDDNQIHIDSVKKLRGDVVTSGAENYLSIFAKNLGLGIEHNIPNYTCYKYLLDEDTDNTVPVNTRLFEPCRKALIARHLAPMRAGVAFCPINSMGLQKSY